MHVVKPLGTIRIIGIIFMRQANIFKYIQNQAGQSACQLAARFLRVCTSEQEQQLGNVFDIFGLILLGRFQAFLIQFD